MRRAVEEPCPTCGSVVFYEHGQLVPVNTVGIRVFLDRALESCHGVSHLRDLPQLLELAREECPDGFPRMPPVHSWVRRHAGRVGAWFLAQPTALVIGLMFGIALTLNGLAWLSRYEGTRVYETWTYTDATAHVWECSRFLGMTPTCSRTEAGTLTFLREGQPEFSPCTVEQSRVVDVPW